MAGLQASIQIGVAIVLLLLQLLERVALIFKLAAQALHLTLEGVQFAGELQHAGTGLRGLRHGRGGLQSGTAGTGIDGLRLNQCRNPEGAAHCGGDKQTFHGCLVSAASGLLDLLRIDDFSAPVLAVGLLVVAFSHRAFLTIAHGLDLTGGGTQQHQLTAHR